MVGNDDENLVAAPRLARLELLFMDLERTVADLNGVVRQQQSKLDQLELTIRQWQKLGIGQGDDPSDETPGESQP